MEGPMTLTDIADALDVKMVVSRDCAIRYRAFLTGVEKVDLQRLGPVHGWGTTQAGAIENLVRSIAGCRIVVDRGTPGELEFDVPQDVAASF
jgi:hypothetical protein